MKGFKYMCYINVLHRGYNVCISVLPQSVFMKIFFLTTFTQYCLSLCYKGYSLLGLNFKLFKISILNW